MPRERETDISSFRRASVPRPARTRRTSGCAGFSLANAVEQDVDALVVGVQAPEEENIVLFARLCQRGVTHAVAYRIDGRVRARSSLQVTGGTRRNGDDPAVQPRVQAFGGGGRQADPGVFPRGVCGDGMVKNHHRPSLPGRKRVNGRERGEVVHPEVEGPLCQRPGSQRREAQTA